MASRLILQGMLLKQHHQVVRPALWLGANAITTHSAASFHTTTVASAAAKKKDADKDKDDDEKTLVSTKGLVDSIAEKHDGAITKADIKAVLTTLPEVIYQNGKDGKQTRVTGLGCFIPVHVPERTYHPPANPADPKTRIKVVKPAQMKMKFRKFKSLDKNTFGEEK